MMGDRKRRSQKARKAENRTGSSKKPCIASNAVERITRHFYVKIAAKDANGRVLC